MMVYSRRNKILDLINPNKPKVRLSNLNLEEFGASAIT